MLFLQITPFTKPIAFAEIIVILLIAASLGYLIAKLLARRGISRIQDEIVEKQVELAECRSIQPSRPSTTSAIVPNRGALKTVYPITESDPEIRHDLKVIEGIGPKIEEILNRNGIHNYAALSAVPATHIAKILRGAGPRFQIHDPTSWPQQASLAQEQKWEELDKLKEELIGGK
jgi:predicted flap endonuclease-1-like 5' DNA nuclease